MNPITAPLMLQDARDRAEREFRRYAGATAVRVTVDSVAYTFRRDAGDIALVEAKELKK